MQKFNDKGASPVIGTVLMLGLMSTLIPGVMMMTQAINDTMEAHREAAEFAAFCARYPDTEGCPERVQPFPGYECKPVEDVGIICHRVNETVPLTGVDE